MEEQKNLEENSFFETIIKKTKTGVTFPKEIRDELFPNDEDTFFQLIIPKEKDKIILKIIPKEEVDKINLKQILEKEEKSKSKTKRSKDPSIPEPKWAEYFVYDIDNREKVQKILESAYYKFTETPINFDDAIGRIKYTLISFLSPTKTDNAKLYYAVIKFLIDIIRNFNQRDLLDWIYDKVIPNIESKFLYELALSDLIEIAYESNDIEKFKLYINKILESIEKYNKSEWYNIMIGLNQLVKKIKNFDLPTEIADLIKEKLVFYGNEADIEDYKIQIIELLESLKFIEVAYNIADELVKSLPPENIKLPEIRKIRSRLKEKPV
ncbi:MAG: hypothetical protein JXA99_10635 [Candidatus Lokiarchaeota archaeon]|nr:hypothetical protein [Candidatus Lokiarchaeota archaeon]